jgi:hypothetical protein
MKFKVGDRIIIPNHTPVSYGTMEMIIDIHLQRGTITELDSVTPLVKIHFDMENSIPDANLWLEEIELEELFDSPLYRALNE